MKNSVRLDSAPVFAEDIRKELQFFFEMELLGIGDRMERKLMHLFKHNVWKPERREFNSAASVKSRRLSVPEGPMIPGSGRNLLSIGNRKSWSSTNRNSSANRSSAVNTTPLSRIRASWFNYPGERAGPGNVESGFGVFHNATPGHESYMSLGHNISTNSRLGHNISANSRHPDLLGGTPSIKEMKLAEGQEVDEDNVQDATVMESPDAPRPSTWTRKSEVRASVAFVRSWYFEMVVASLLILNAASLGMQSDFCARHQTTNLPQYYVFLDRLFCAVFVLEQGLKYKILGCDMFYAHPNEETSFLSYSAITDFILVLLQVFSEVFASRQGHEIGALQLLQIIRTFSVFRAVRPLRSLLVSVIDSVRLFSISMILLVLVTYVFSVIMTFVATSTQIQADEDLPDLMQYFGSVDRSFLTLFEVVSDGVHWREVVEPLIVSCPPVITVAFIIYTTLALFVLVNIITSSFIEGALHKGEEERKCVLMYEIADLILAADEDGSGTISWDEFQAHLSAPQMQVLLKAIDFNTEEARALFRLLDTEDNGEIEVEEFMSGCVRLQGGAKAVELAALLSELGRFQKEWRAHAVKVEELLSHVPPSQDDVFF